jgi:phosphatidyl-myo-inositol alpha-mannosyltransferase
VLLRWFLLGAVTLVAAALAAYALEKIGLHRIGDALAAVSAPWLLLSFALMSFSMALRAESWYALLRAALSDAHPHRAETLRGTGIGVFVSASLPGRLGEPIRALILSRRLGDVRRRLPVVLGTVVSQSLLNVLALLGLAVITLGELPLVRGHVLGLGLAVLVPASLVAALVLAPRLIRGIKWRRVPLIQVISGVVANRVAEARRGLLAFRDPLRGVHASLAQFAAWAVQTAACYVLFVAFDLQGRIGLGAAAAVLLAVNVTAILPPTPSNVGIFQAACVLVLSLEGIGKGDALAYGIVLQLVEVTTAVALGVPSLVKEGVSWREIRATAADIKAGRDDAEAGPSGPRSP